MAQSLGELLNITGAPLVSRTLEGMIPVIRTVTSPVWAAVATITTAEQDMTVAGVEVGDFVFVNKPTAQAGLGVAGARVKAKDTVAVVFVNPTAASITPTASELWKVLHTRVTA